MGIAMRSWRWCCFYSLAARVAFAAHEPENRYLIRIAADLRHEYGLKDSAVIEFQRSAEDATSLYLDGADVDVSSSVPMDVYARGRRGVVSEASATSAHRMGRRDDVVDVFEVPSERGETILMSKTMGKFIKFLPDGKTREVIRVSSVPNLVATIRSEDYLEENDSNDLVDIVPPMKEKFGNRRELRQRRIRIRSSVGSWYDRRLEDLGPCATYHVIRMALRYDSRFCAQNGNTHEGAEAELRFIVAEVSKLYERQGMCMRVQICSMGGYCEGDQDEHLFGDILASSEDYCGREDTALERLRTIEIPGEVWPEHLQGCDALHFIVGGDENPVEDVSTVGCAFSGQLCSHWAVGVSYFSSAMTDTRKAILLAHELGHNLSGEHQFASSSSIMRGWACSKCDLFSTANREHIEKFVNSIASETCIGVERVDDGEDSSNSPEIPTLPDDIFGTGDEPDPETPSDTQDSDRCSEFSSRKLCNQAYEGETCTYHKTSDTCRDRVAMDCTDFDGKYRCLFHGDHCIWRQRQCWSAQ